MDEGNIRFELLNALLLVNKFLEYFKENQITHDKLFEKCMFEN